MSSFRDGQEQARIDLRTWRAAGRPRQWVATTSGDWYEWRAGYLDEIGRAHDRPDLLTIEHRGLIAVDCTKRGWREVSG